MSSPAARRLARAFFARPAEEVAHELVGKLLLRADDGLVARLVEVEAYTQDDPASHAFRGRTARTAPMFGPAGHAYVYFTYGMHWCANVSTGPDGHGEAVLLRAAEPLEGLACMRARRGRAARADRDLLGGPARLAQGFGLDGAWSGRDLCAPGALLSLADDGARPEVVRGPRVGVVEAADWPRRFVAGGSRWASAYKRHPRAPGVTARPGAARAPHPGEG